MVVLVLTPSSSAETIDFREEAPAAATEDMYSKDPRCTSNVSSVTRHCSSRLGGLAVGTGSSAPGFPLTRVGVPGEVRGLELAWQRHGRLPWKDVVMPVVKVGSPNTQRVLKATDCSRWLSNIQVYK